MELGELEEGAWILRRRTRVWDLERRQKGDGGLKASPHAADPGFSMDNGFCMISAF